MKILLDTHLLIWIHTNTSKLPQTFLSYTQDPENEFFYSSASIWETQIKYTKNKALFPISGSILDKYCLLVLFRANNEYIVRTIRQR